MADIEAGRIDCVVVYKVDRLSRSFLDFAQLMRTFEERSVAFVSVTQQFNTASSMGRLILNVLLAFAQSEREIIGERTRDKIAATRRKGKWAGGDAVLGYDVDRTSACGTGVLRPGFNSAAVVNTAEITICGQLSLITRPPIHATASHRVHRNGPANHVAGRMGGQRDVAR
jgi:DNA invertase Pin-like site-specific DNA recombinase